MEAYLPKQKIKEIKSNQRKIEKQTHPHSSLWRRRICSPRLPPSVIHFPPGGKISKWFLEIVASSQEIEI